MQAKTRKGFLSKPSIRRTKPSNVFGHIEGVPVGSMFENRLFLHHSSIHSGIMAGISGSKMEGCYSVVMSGGYEDDKDQGYKFTYTGCGGRDQSNGEKPREGPQTCDQTWDNARNESLRISSHTKKPVRVVRGYNSSSDFAPCKGYRYDGLYVVDRAWIDVGKSGYKVCKFAFTRLPDQPPIPRRQGTLDLDISEWEGPRHFGKNTETPLSSVSTPSSSSRKRKEQPSAEETQPLKAQQARRPGVPRDVVARVEDWVQRLAARGHPPSRDQVLVRLTMLTSAASRQALPAPVSSSPRALASGERGDVKRFKADSSAVPRTKHIKAESVNWKVIPERKPLKSESGFGELAYPESDDD